MFLRLQVHAAPGRVPHGACAHVSSAGCCRGPGAAWGTQRPPRGSQTGNGSGDKLFYLQSGSSFDWEPCVAWSRRETGRQVTAWLRCFLKRAQLKIPEGFLRPGACVWGPAASSPAPAPVCTVLGGGPCRAGKQPAESWSLAAGQSVAKQTAEKRKHVFPAWDGAGLVFTTSKCCALFPLGSFSLRKQSNHFSKNSAVTQKRNISSYGKALGDLRRDRSSRVL